MTIIEKIRYCIVIAIRLFIILSIWFVIGFAGYMIGYARAIEDYLSNKPLKYWSKGGKYEKLYKQERIDTVNKGV